MFFFFKPQANDVPSTTHGKKGTVSVKYTSVFFSFVTPRSDGSLLLLSRSPACLEGTDVLSQSPSAPRFFFLVVQQLLAPLLEIFFSLTAYVDSLRYDRYAWTVGF